MKKEILKTNKEKNIQLVYEVNDINMMSVFIIETLSGNMLYNFAEESEAVKKFEEMEK